MLGLPHAGQKGNGANGDCAIAGVNLEIPLL